MTRMVLVHHAFVISALLAGGFALGDEPAVSPKPEQDTALAPTTTDARPALNYLLRYRFNPGETLRWKVVHRAKIDTTVSGTTQTAETTSTSIKVWRVLPADKPGQFCFEHSVESVEMRQQLTGREEVVYNSATDKEPPAGFEDAAKAVGIPLSAITVDQQGNVVNRQQKLARATDAQGQITVPMPAEAIPVGHVWSFPYEVQVPLKSGEVRQIKTRQRFTLEEVNGAIATIGVETQIMTPVQDPEVQAQLIQRESAGKIKFNIADGRIIEQRMDLDKSVLGFSGETSSLHYVTRFTEELLPTGKIAGPVAPKPTKQAARPRTKPAPRQAATSKGRTNSGSANQRRR